MPGAVRRVAQTDRETDRQDIVGVRTKANNDNNEMGIAQARRRLLLLFLLLDDSVWSPTEKASANCALVFSLFRFVPFSFFFLSFSAAFAISVYRFVPETCTASHR